MSPTNLWPAFARARDGNLRISRHCCNTAADIEQALAALHANRDLLTTLLGTRILASSSDAGRNLPVTALPVAGPSRRT